MSKHVRNHKKPIQCQGFRVRPKFKSYACYVLVIEDPGQITNLLKPQFLSLNGDNSRACMTRL
jgi:hypothetical protein